MNMYQMLSSAIEEELVEIDKKLEIENKTKRVEEYLNNYQTLDSNVLTELDAIVNNEEMFEEQEKTVEKKPAIDKKKDYLLKDNIDKTLTYQVADCCNPIPGDAIVGFVDENNNVIIHKKICPKAISLATVQGEKIINAKWTKHTFTIKLYLYRMFNHRRKSTYFRKIILN